MTISAFKLFYDEFIYKKNVMINYLNIDKNINTIRELAFQIRNTYRGNKDEYNNTLNDIHFKLKEELNEINKVEPYLFEVYYIIYKNKITIGTDTVFEMPFIIATSFYEDYRLDHENEEETRKNWIPRYTSLDKKRMKNDYKKLGLSNYFLELLNERPGKYVFCIDRINELNAIKPLYDESELAFSGRIEDVLKDFSEIIIKCEKKAKKSIDYEAISEALELVLRRKVDSWQDIFLEYYKDYFAKLYEKNKKSNSILNGIFIANDISFESFEDLCTELALEKEKLYADFNNAKELKIVIDDDSYCADFRRKMLIEYFDERIREEIPEARDAMVMASYIYRLASFSVDLEDRVFNRILYEASHAPSLKRGNDVRSAVINKIYDLYNPCYLLSVYEEKRKKVEKVLDNAGQEFNLTVENMLRKINDQNKQNYSLLALRQIKKDLIERKKKFLIEHYIDVKSQDIFGYYDTRDYDLSILCCDLDLNDLTNVYNLTKYKIKNEELVENSSIIKEYDSLNDRRNRLLQEVLGFYAEQVLKIVYENKIDDKELYWSLVKDMAKKYLGDEYKGYVIAGRAVKKGVENDNKYCMKKEEFLGQSKFGQLIKFAEKAQMKR